MSEWKLVPVEPDNVMVDTLLHYFDDSPRTALREAIAAAPAVSAEPCAFQILADGCKPDIVLDKWRVDDLLRTTEALGIKATVHPLYLHPPAPAVADAINACIGIVERYRVPVGNSSAGELACEWTMDALQDIRDEMRELLHPLPTPPKEDEK